MPKFFAFTEHRFLEPVFNEQAAVHGLCIAPASEEGRLLKPNERMWQHHRGVFARRNVATWKGISAWVEVGRYQFEGIELYAQYYQQYIHIIEPILAKYEQTSGEETFITRLTRV